MQFFIIKVHLINDFEDFFLRPIYLFMMVEIQKKYEICRQKCEKIQRYN